MLNMKDRHHWKSRFYNLARLVIVMLRRGFATKRLQKIMKRIHELFKRLESTTVAYDRMLLNFDNHWEEFSCGSTPVKANNKPWDENLHFLFLRALPCVCPTAREDQNGSNNVMSFHDQQQCSPMNDLCSPQVDRRAEEFITAFYQQMRLQRQDSYQQCQEMLARAT